MMSKSARQSIKEKEKVVVVDEDQMNDMMDDDVDYYPDDGTDNPNNMAAMEGTPNELRVPVSHA